LSHGRELAPNKETSSKMKKHRKICQQGATCPYRHEYQHNLEFQHVDTKPQAPKNLFQGKAHVVGGQNPLPQDHRELFLKKVYKRSENKSTEEDIVPFKRVLENVVDLSPAKREPDKRASIYDSGIICRNEHGEDGLLQLAIERSLGDISTPKMPSEIVHPVFAILDENQIKSAKSAEVCNVLEGKQKLLSSKKRKYQDKVEMIDLT
jgi:hypothetical protein